MQYDDACRYALSRPMPSIVHLHAPPEDDHHYYVYILPPRDKLTPKPPHVSSICGCDSEVRLSTLLA